MGPGSVNSGYYTVDFGADSGEVIDGFYVSGNTFDQPLLINNASGSTVRNIFRCNDIGSFTSANPVTWGSC